VPAVARDDGPASSSSAAADDRSGRLAAIGELAAGVAHDFNNIVGTISLYVDLLEATASLDEVGLSYLAAIRLQIDSGAALGWQVLDLAARSLLERVDIDLASFVGDILPALRRTLRDDVGLVLGDSGPCIARADPTRVRQILTNLVSNASDSFDGPGQITITLATGMDGVLAGPWVRLEVADTGRGIAPSVLHRVFDPYVSTKPRGQGTGLGLSQVRGLVAQHGGEIEIESTPAGTVVAILLPRVPQPIASGGLDAPQLVGSPVPHVLLVDDDPPVAEAMRRVLSSLGYHVTVAVDAERAVGLLEDGASAVSLVLSDVSMRGMGGEGLARVMADRWPDLPLILASGGQPVGGLWETSTAAPTRLTKPFSSTELAETLRGVLRARGSDHRPSRTS